MTCARFRFAAAFLALSWVSAGCQSEADLSTVGDDRSGMGPPGSGGNAGPGGFLGLGGSPGAGGAGGSGSTSGPDCGLITAVVRDFQDSHPDFEVYQGNTETTGIVAEALSPDGKPVFASRGQPPMVTSAESFGDWYRDLAGVNQAIRFDIRLVSGPGKVFVYDNASFFPLDDRGFGNQGRAHNYHFTTEVHLKFRYGGGEVFTFKGDDDLWLFINRKLALDLGGLHPVVSGTVNLDQQAARLGIVPGNEYPMDVFHAERHTVASNFRVETTIACLRNVIE